MLLSEAVSEKLKSLLAKAPSWKNLTESQFVKHLAIFLGWEFENAAFKVERAHQEGFIDTALNRSSILAHGEGREYMPRKPVPATGKAAVTNQGEYPISLQRGREFMSDAQVVYTLEAAAVVDPMTTVTVAVSQRMKQVFEFEVSEEKAFYEILFDRETSPKIVEFAVFVDEGEGFKEWEYDRLLTNSYPDSLVYDEFYHFTDQIGIRFGNGDFGKIPTLGAAIRVEAVLTEGDTILLEKQSLWPVEEIKDSMNQTAQAQIIVSETVQNGEAQEETEEMRRNLHYAPVYNERLVWDNDYRYFLHRRYPDVVFVRAWGEEEAEKMWGYSVDHINRIWLCAYSPERDIKADAMAAIAEIPMMCRNFQWHDPEHLEFQVVLTGKVRDDCILSEVLTDIRNGLNEAYGKASETRRDTVYLNEVYDIIQATGYFAKDTGAWFNVELRGRHTAEYIYQMVSIDMAGSTFDITYLR